MNGRPLAYLFDTVHSAPYSTQYLVGTRYWDGRGAGTLKEECHSPLAKVAGKPGAHKGGTEKPGEMRASTANWCPLQCALETQLETQYILEMGSGVLCTKQIIGI